MNPQYQKNMDNLNNDNVSVRLDNLKALMTAIEKGKLERPVTGMDVNNHIHTFYSFSPYSPSKALWMAYNAGLRTAGIMDHDSISGAKEFIEAGKIIGISTTIGAECRVDFSNTRLKGRLVNNPDQKSIVYMAIHGIPHTQIGKVNDFFIPYTAHRNKRNILMTDKINEIIKPYNLQLDYGNDIRPLSKSAEGGSITERHILFGLSKKLVDRYGRGAGVVNFLRDSLKIDLNSKIEKLLMDKENCFYEYDLLGALKSDMVKMFYVDAQDECPDVREVIGLCREIGAISAYAYLGDVVDSVTGDKKAQKFEDDYIEELFEVIKGIGFNAVTYMPSRNTLEQLKRVKGLCEKHGLFQISGEDINSPRQSFVCSAMRNEEFRNLLDSTWALIGHEKAATADLKNGMFTNSTIRRYPGLGDRIQIYEKIGMAGS